MSDDPWEFDRSAVVTIQGGGVYGLSLLGQLETLVRIHKIRPIGIAGTSAGAVVATLWWAGFSPSEIRDMFVALANENALLRLLEPAEPSANGLNFEDALKLWTNGGKQLDELAAQLQRPKQSFFAKVRGYMQLAWSLRKVKNDIAHHLPRLGLFSGGIFENTIDQWIRSSKRLRSAVAHIPHSRLVTFGDLRDVKGLPPLFVAATNVTTQQLEVFNSVQSEYDSVPVARAVRASTGVPLFFEPVTFVTAPNPGWYVDGGMISNFPAWVFSYELRRLLATVPRYAALVSRPWIHFGLRLRSDDDTATAHKSGCHTTSKPTTIRQVTHQVGYVPVSQSPGDKIGITRCAFGYRRTVNQGCRWAK